MVSSGKEWSRMVKNGQKWSKIVNNGQQLLSKMLKHVHNYIVHMVIPPIALGGGNPIASPRGNGGERGINI